MEKIRELGDSSATHAIDDQNEALKLRLDGHDKEAEALERRQRIQDKILDEQRLGHDEAVEALKEQLSLQDQLDEIEASKAEREASTRVMTENEDHRRKEIVEQRRKDKERADLQYRLFENLNDQSEAQANLRALQAKALLGTGEVSSLRRIGLDVNSSGVSRADDTAKEVRESNKRLDRLIQEYEVLNAKVGAT